MERLAWTECEPYSGIVNATARRYAGRSGAEFDDLVQEGWESVCVYLTEGSQPTEASIERWIRLYIRQLERLHKGDQVTPLVYGGTPQKPDIQIHIRDQLQELPPESRTVILLYGFGFNLQEIGNWLRVHRTTASIRVKDALIKLRRLL